MARGDELERDRPDVTADDVVARPRAVAIDDVRRRAVAVEPAGVGRGAEEGLKPDTNVVAKPALSALARLVQPIDGRRGLASRLPGRSPAGSPSAPVQPEPTARARACRARAA